jgi:tetratricopeptide (TPR) repeat protein
MKERALELYLKAARYAARIYANRRGIDAYQRALDLCEREEDRGPIAEELGELYTRIGEYPQALDCFRLARALQEKKAGASRSPEDLTLLDKIGKVLQRQGEFEGALSMFSQCLESSGDQPAIRARSLFRIGGIHLDRGDLAAATSSLGESLKLYEELGDFGQLAAVQSGLGLAEKHQDRLDRAVERFEEALKNAERSGILLDVATTLNNLGNAHRARGDDHRAVQCLRRSVETRERIGDRQGLAICLNNIARVYFYRGEIGAARSSTETALKIFEEVGDKKGVLIARSNLGEAVHHLGQLEMARRFYTANLDLARRLRIQRLLETNLCNLGTLETDAGEYAIALEYLQRCLRTLSGEKPLELRAQALGALGAVCLRLHDLEGAEDAWREGLEISRELKLREKLGGLASLEVRLHLEKGDPDRALFAGKQFLKQTEHGVEKLGLAIFHLELGRAYRELGPDWADQTEKHLNRALKDFERMQSPHNAAAARIELGLYWRLLGEENETALLFAQAEEEFRKAGAPRRLEELSSLRSAS